MEGLPSSSSSCDSGPHKPHRLDGANGACGRGRVMGVFMGHKRLAASVARVNIKRRNLATSPASRCRSALAVSLLRIRVASICWRVSTAIYYFVNGVQCLCTYQWLTVTTVAQFFPFNRSAHTATGVIGPVMTQSALSEGRDKKIHAFIFARWHTVQNEQLGMA